MIKDDIALMEEVRELLLSDEVSDFDKAMLADEAALYLGVGNIARMARQLGRVRKKFDESKYRRDSGGKFDDKPDVAPPARTRKSVPSQMTPRSVKSGRVTTHDPKARPTAGQIKRDTQGLPQREGQRKQKSAAKKAEESAQRSVMAEAMRFLTNGHPADNSTETFYSEPTPTGGRRYTPERSQFHRDLIKAALAGKPKRKEGEATAIFTAGGTAAGKSTYLNRHLAQFQEDAVHVDPDEAKKKIPEYGALVSQHDTTAGFRVHEESSQIAKAIQTAGVNANHDLLIDGTGNAPPGKFVGKIKSMLDSGYKAQVRYVDAPTEEAHARNLGRAAKTGRLVPYEMVEENHFHSSRNIDEVLDIPEVDVEVWSSQNNPPTLLARRPANGKLEVVDQEGWEAFRAKGESVGKPSPETLARYQEFEVNALKKASSHPDPAVAARAALEIRRYEANDAARQLVRSFEDGPDFDPQVVSAAEKKIAQARFVEPEITSRLTEVADANGTEMSGLDFRFKGPKRLMEKIAEDAEQDRITPEDAAEDIKDALRYTMIIPEGGDAAAIISQTKASMKANGSRVWSKDGKCGEKDFRGGENGYKGYHWNFVAQGPDGSQTPVELQFHTRKSLQVKEAAHGIYEEARVLPQGHPRRVQLEQEIKDTWASVEFPTQPIERDC